MQSSTLDCMESSGTTTSLTSCGSQYAACFPTDTRVGASGAHAAGHAVTSSKITMLPPTPLSDCEGRGRGLMHLHGKWAGRRACSGTAARFESRVRV